MIFYSVIFELYFRYTKVKIRNHTFPFTGYGKSHDDNKALDECNSEDQLFYERLCWITR